MILEPEVYSKIFDTLHDGLYFVDRDRIIQYWNRAAEKISGYSAAEVLGKSCAENILTHVDSSGRNLCQGLCPLAKAMDEGVGSEAEIFLQHKDGHRMPVSVRITPLTDTSGRVIGGAELFFDISNFKSIELRIRELEELALLDNLTRLANRHCIEKELLVRVEEQRRFGIPFGILFMDIDHFKQFNDLYGHAAGDRVLKSVATTLSKNARPFDVFGRWGGEEFIGIMRNVTFDQLEHLGQRIRSLVHSSSLLLDNEPRHVSMSIGATLMREGDSIESLVKRADSLLYESKQGGRNRLTMG